MKAILDAYFIWKDLDDRIKSLEGNTRGLIFPSELSEHIVCKTLGLIRNTDRSGGDAFDIDGNVIEIKTLSSENFTAPHSFSPTEEFDDVIFAHLIKREDIIFIYDLNMDSDAIGGIQVNRNQTISEQKSLGRRPRISLYDYVKSNGIKPVRIIKLESDRIVDVTETYEHTLYRGDCLKNCRESLNSFFDL